VWTKTLIGMGDPEMNRASKREPEPDKEREEANTAPENKEKGGKKGQYA
jgi:hypothetical protein